MFRQEKYNLISVYLWLIMNVKLQILSHLKQQVLLFTLPYRHVTSTQAFNQHLKIIK